jgi:hypothetical protein
MAAPLVVDDEWHDYSCSTPLETLASDLERQVERWLTELGLALTGLEPRPEASGPFWSDCRDISRECFLVFEGQELLVSLRVKLPTIPEDELALPVTEDACEASWLSTRALVSISPLEAPGFANRMRAHMILSALRLAIAAIVDRARKAAPLDQARVTSAGASIEAEHEALAQALSSCNWLLCGVVRVLGRGHSVGCSGSFVHLTPSKTLVAGGDVSSAEALEPVVAARRGVEGLREVIAYHSRCFDAHRTPSPPDAHRTHLCRDTLAWFPQSRVEIPSSRSRLLTMLAGGSVGGAYSGRAPAELPAPKELQHCLWRVPLGLWSNSSDEAGSGGASALAGAVDPVCASLTAVNGLEPLWGSLSRDPVAGIAFHHLERNSEQSVAIVTVRWAGGTSISRSRPVPRDEDPHGCIVAASSMSCLFHHRGGRWLLPLDPEAGQCLIREMESQPASPRDTLEHESEEEDDDPSAHSEDSFATADDPQETVELSVEAALQKCSLLISEDTPLASRSFGIVRSLKKVLERKIHGLSACSYARRELEAAIGRSDLPGVPGDGSILGSAAAAADAARESVRRQREGVTVGSSEYQPPSLYKSASEAVWGRPGDELVAFRQRVMLRSSRLRRGLALQGRSLLAHAPGARTAAAMSAAINSLASSVKAVVRGDDPLPRADTIIAALDVLFAGAPASRHELLLKGCAPGGLASRLGVLVSRCMGTRGIAILWRAFVSELRALWEGKHAIPHIHGADTRQLPDMRNCLMEQKLAMLSWCGRTLAMGHAIAGPDKAPDERDTLAMGHAIAGPDKAPDERGTPLQEVTESSCVVTPAKAAEPGRSTDEEGDDWEVSGLDSFESAVTLATPMADSTTQALADRSTNTISTQPDPPSVVRRGQKRLLPGMMLLRTRLAMWEPLTQPGQVFTEDTLAEHQRLMAQLGTGSKAQVMRTKLFLNGMRSDMMAFRAANPTCCFADFVRWHSPSDWVSSEEGDGSSGLTGRLSSRFSGMTAVVAGVDDELPPPEGITLFTAWDSHPEADGPPPSDDGGADELGDQLWRTAWEASKPTSLEEQTPVINAELKGERAMEFFESMPLGELHSYMFAACATNAAVILHKACPQALESSAIVRDRVHHALEQLRTSCDMAHEAAMAGTALPAGDRTAGVGSTSVDQGYLLARFADAACVAVCALADAETALSRFVSLSNHLDPRPSGVAHLWRTADSVMRAPMPAGEQLSADLSLATQAAALLCGSVTPASPPDSIAALICDALRDDRTFFPAQFHMSVADLTNGTMHLIPPAPPRDPTHPLSVGSWASQSMFQSFDAASRDGSEPSVEAVAKALDELEPRDETIKRSIASVLKQGHSEKSIRTMRHWLSHRESKPRPPRPSQRLCVTVITTPEEEGLIREALRTAGIAAAATHESMFVHQHVASGWRRQLFGLTDQERLRLAVVASEEAPVV